MTSSRSSSKRVTGSAQYAPSKPALIGEFGLADDKWRLSEFLKQDPECLHFETSLWAAAFAGGSGTALFWWWDQLDRQNVYPHYRPLAEYMRGVSFAGMKTAKAQASDANLGILGYQSDVGRLPVDLRPHGHLVQPHRRKKIA